MRNVLFISDLHLCESRPKVTQQFIDWLNHLDTDTQAVYILGDFFEYWVGDDATSPAFHPPIFSTLSKLVEKKVSVYLMHGNRDFLIGEDFSAQTGVKLLPDPTLLTLFGKTILLTHGDQLCTDDLEYMNFRQMVRQPTWQTTFLSQPVAQRNAFVKAARAKSEQDKANKSMAIMDVNQSAVEALIRQYSFPEYLVHGHTHRPKQHFHTVDGHQVERWVLGDWYDQGSCLQLDEQGRFTSINIA
jgi:UDP-2,3-diacylglucosamine hydrolase